MSEKRYKSTTLELLDWETVAGQFNLSREYIHLGSSQCIASHPAIVRKAIEKFRKILDENPVLAMQEHEEARMQDSRKAIADYMNALPNHVALTDSTTAGLAILYNGIRLEHNQEIIATEHEHYSHAESIRLAAEKKNIPIHRIPLYKDIHKVSEQEIVDAVVKHITPKTRLIALTWVHSNTGLKLPIRRITEAIAPMNRERSENDRIIVCVDGVHGFGVETETLPELGCDFFVSGCHKWLCGPRGTGMIVARKGAWELIEPTTPSFTYIMNMWISGEEPPEKKDGLQLTPGGVHAAEHRWALPAAFEFHREIGRQRVADRVHELALYCKEELAKMPHVRLFTPMSRELSAGIISFLVKGQRAPDTVNYLMKHKIIATKAPCMPSYVRLTPGLYNSFEDIDAALQALRSLA